MDDISVFGYQAEMKKPIVLLVEDSEDLRFICAEILGMAGFDVRLSGSGTETLALLKAGLRPACMLFDLGLPGMSPEQFFSEFRKLPCAATTPVVLASGNSDLRAWAERLGISQMIRKPFDMDVLVRTVSDLCSVATSGVGSFL
jgi:DNA-binding NtrC family response regulator